MTQKKSYSLRELAAYAGATVVGDENCVVSGLATLKQANSRQLSFLSNASYQKYLHSTQAGCVILHSSCEHLFDGNKLVTDNPYHFFAQITQLFYIPPKINGVHKSVIIGESSQISDTASIDANVVIGDNVAIAAGVIVGAGSYIGNNTHIGEGSIIHANVSIYSDTQIGRETIIHSQAVIGADGFGFAPTSNKMKWQKIYQLGGVVIGSCVEIGAGTTIDRGALDHTIIGDGVKLDNQIQIAHNVEIGENTAIAGATAIAGSTTIGKRCTIAGAVGIIGHLTITDDVHITAMTLVTKSIHVSGSYSSGTPMNQTDKWRKNAARFNHLDRLAKKLSSQKDSSE